MMRDTRGVLQLPSYNPEDNFTVHDIKTLEHPAISKAWLEQAKEYKKPSLPPLMPKQREIKIQSVPYIVGLVVIGMSCCFTLLMTICLMFKAFFQAIH
jgi:hypothetical protein